MHYRGKQMAVLIMLLWAWMMLNSSVIAQNEEGHDSRGESDRESPIGLNPALGQEIGFIYEAFLSPQQEGGEEEDTPVFIPPEFRSTAPSVPRNQRTSRGHAVLEFTNDLSKAYAYLAVENVNPDDVVMLHLHCGRPGQLGPIIVDFALMGNINEYLADGLMKMEIVNEDIAATAAHGEGLLGVFTAGCPIITAIPTDKVKTVAGMELIAREGEIYFNLHTKGQTYFGDMRGQFHLVEGG